MTMATLRIQLKAKNGRHLINKLTVQSTLDELKSEIASLTKVPHASMRILSGFPPKPMDLTDGSVSLNSMAIKTGETLIIEDSLPSTAVEVTPIQEPSVPKSSALHNDDHLSLPTSNGNENQSNNGLTRKPVPANNSCLFTSVNYLLEGGKLNLDVANGMRELIASIVAGDDETYNEAFLGRTNDDYCAFILSRDSWGGAIEVSILSNLYQVEICVVDTQHVRVNRFGEDKNFPQRVFLIYDGIHYDPLVQQGTDGSDRIQTIFDTTDNNVMSLALSTAAEAKKQRQYTDTTNFTLRCLVCQKQLKGETQAQEHAKSTGHANFGEI